MVGFDGAMFEPLSNQNLKDWILQDDELNALYGLIRTYQGSIIETYRQKCNPSSN